MVTVVDHQFCLTAIDADIFTGDEAGLLRCQKQHHMGNIQGITDPTGRLLHLHHTDVFITMSNESTVWVIHPEKQHIYPHLTKTQIS